MWLRCSQIGDFMVVHVYQNAQFCWHFWHRFGNSKYMICWETIALAFVCLFNNGIKIFLTNQLMSFTLTIIIDPICCFTYEFKSSISNTSLIFLAICVNILVLQKVWKLDLDNIGKLTFWFLNYNIEMKLVLQEAKRHQSIVTIFQIVLAPSFFKRTTLEKPLVNNFTKRKDSYKCNFIHSQRNFCNGLLPKDWLMTIYHTLLAMTSSTSLTHGCRRSTFNYKS